MVTIADWGQVYFENLKSWNLILVYSIIDFASCVWGPEICQVTSEAWSVVRWCQPQYARAVVAGDAIFLLPLHLPWRYLWKHGPSPAEGKDESRDDCYHIWHWHTVHAITLTTLLKEMMSTCFLNTCKHHGYVLHGYGWVGKYCKHPGGHGLAGGAHHHWCVLILLLVISLPLTPSLLPPLEWTWVTANTLHLPLLSNIPKSDYCRLGLGVAQSDPKRICSYILLVHIHSITYSFWGWDATPAAYACQASFSGTWKVLMLR